ncbi:MAG: hypothetical protein CM1200mP24_10130 [Gammaproteobacteria bacterium]|nr:MAG: hypothetical protein CM1200mP24_10130 [Gammaproteobacteria bacterium]
MLRTDVWITLVLLTCATIPFYFLGAGVLNAMGERPEGNDTITALSHMFTETLGPWSLWVFAVGAFSILYSSTIAGKSGRRSVYPGLSNRIGFHVARSGGSSS